jgi:hypothetical protein
MEVLSRGEGANWARGKYFYDVIANRYPGEAIPGKEIAAPARRHGGRNDKRG